MTPVIRVHILSDHKPFIDGKYFSELLDANFEMSYGDGVLSVISKSTGNCYLLPLNGIKGMQIKGVKPVAKKIA